VGLIEVCAQVVGAIRLHAELELRTLLEILDEMIATLAVLWSSYLCQLDIVYGQLLMKVVLLFV